MVNYRKVTLTATTTNQLIGAHRACCFDGMMHYSSDFVQQVHYPSSPLQPGLIYLKTPRKCGLFCICCEAFPKQVNFLIDESVQTGK